MSMEIVDDSDEIVYPEPQARTYVTMEIPGKHTLSDLAALLGDNQEFVTQVNTRGPMW